MILTNTKKDNEMALNINNDIYRLVKGLNEIEDFKRLLICSDYALKEKKDLSINLIDKVIVRTPLIPNINKSICAITINKAISKDNSYYLQISVDILTPLNQWLVIGGIRPLLLCSRKYNMHLMPCALQIEIGTDANTLLEAVYSAELFAESLSQLLKEYEN